MENAPEEFHQGMLEDLHQMSSSQVKHDLCELGRFSLKVGSELTQVPSSFAQGINNQKALDSVGKAMDHMARI